MIIANSVLRYHLRNVFWIGGGTCGGKTTLANLLRDKYTLPVYHCEDVFQGHKQIANTRDHPNMLLEFDNDWDWFFNRSVEEYINWLKGNSREHLEMIICDLLKISQGQQLIVEGVFDPLILKEIALENQVIYLYAEPEIIVSQYFDRAHTRPTIDIIKNNCATPQKALDNVLKVVARASQEDLHLAQDCGIPCLVRNTATTFGESLQFIESIWNLT